MNSILESIILAGERDMSPMRLAQHCAAVINAQLGEEVGRLAVADQADVCMSPILLAGLLRAALGQDVSVGRVRFEGGVVVRGGK